jgi:hypothetical protein
MIVRSPPYLVEEAGGALVATGGFVAAVVAGGCVAAVVAGGFVAAVVDGVTDDWPQATVTTIKATNSTVKNNIRFTFSCSSLA